jgi:glucose/arabinose dehydrogenase
MMTTSRIRLALGAGLAAMCLAGAAAPRMALAQVEDVTPAKAPPPAAAPAPAKAAKPAEPNTLDPRGPQAVDVQLSALAPANLHKPRPKAPFDMTGTWFVDLSHGFSSWMFGPPYPKFLPAAQHEVDAAAAASKEGRAYKDDIGACYPAGMPVIMTRVWPIAMIQLPTAVYMVAGFENELRIIYTDGRKHSDPDVVVRSYDGESIGHWEGKELVVDTRYFETSHHTIDAGIPISKDFRMVERIGLSPDGKKLHIHYAMWDPQNWEGEWDSDKSWNRVDDQDITEVECTPDLDKRLPSTTSTLNIR